MRLSVLAVLALAPLSAAAQADLIITGGRVWTGDSTGPWAEAVAVQGTRILAVGPVSEVLRHRTGRTRVREMTGRFVLPGFIDNHTHFG
ncbi:MAG: amidohydrolase, partial [Gemmatimonadales bacterium]